MRQGLFIALAYLGSAAAGLAVTAFLWPPWYELALVIPLIERLTHVALAVTSGVVATALGLELLAGVPLLSWLLCLVENLTTSGGARAPAAAWREVRAEGAGWRRRMAQRRAGVCSKGLGQSGPRTTPDDQERRAYADVWWEHSEHGDEDPPLYGAPAPASDEDEALPAARARSRVRLSALAGLDLVRAQLASTPVSDTARRTRLRAEEAGLLAIAVRFARAGPGDGRRLSVEESADLMRTVFGDEQRS